MNPTAITILLGLPGLLLLCRGADWLVRGGVGVARRLGVPSLVIGLTLVAFGTSAPELVVSVDAALKGCGGLSLGNVVGSNICNIALILGAAALAAPVTVNRRLYRRDFPLLAAASGLLLLFFWLNGRIDRWDAGAFLGILAAYTVWNAVAGRRAGSDEGEGGEKPLSAWAALGLALAGIAGLVAGAKLLVNAAVRLAEVWGVSDAVIGLTVVAIGTSLPELATSLTAARRKESDIAVGNVVGSNLFNILGILGVAPLIQPIAGEGIQWGDLWTMMGLTLLLPAMGLKRGKIGRKWGLALCAVYAGYTAWRLLRR